VIQAKPGRSGSKRWRLQIRLPTMNQLSTLNPQQLEQAFQLFNATSSDLCRAYEELRQQALELTQELELANGELQRQFAEKQALRESAQRNARQAAMGEMAARLAQQLRAPLTTALLHASQLGDQDLPATERWRLAGEAVQLLRDLEQRIGSMQQVLIEATQSGFDGALQPRMSKPALAMAALANAAGLALDMKSVERAHILETLLAVNGSRKQAVARLGISERALRYKLQQYRSENFELTQGEENGH
jgi:DNA-binding NtrC family response regulator